MGRENGVYVHESGDNYCCLTFAMEGIMGKLISSAGWVVLGLLAVACLASATAFFLLGAMKIWIWF